MVRKTLIQIARDALVAMALPNLVWAYLNWRHKLGVGPIFVWPWVLITTLLYSYRADKFKLNSGGLGVIAYDFRSIRVASQPFFAAVTFPLLNFLFSSQAPGKSMPIVLIVSGVSWWLHDVIATVSRLVRPNFPP